MLASLGVAYEIKPFLAAKDATNAYYEPSRSANIEVSGKLLGHVGEIKRKVLREFKLPEGVAAFELDLEVLLASRGAKAQDFRTSQYPFVSRDITLTVPAAQAYAPLADKIRAELAAKNLIYRLNCTSIYQAENSETKNISFHLEFADPEKTLAKAEIQAIMDTLEKIK